MPVFNVHSAQCPVCDLLQIEPECLVTAQSVTSVYVRVTPTYCLRMAEIISKIVRLSKFNIKKGNESF